MNMVQSAKGRNRMPPRPRAFLGSFRILPRVDEGWNLIPDQWVLPGCRVVTTDELRKLASSQGKILTIQRR